MAKFQSFTESFDANVINASVWSTSSGTPAASSQRLTLTVASGAANYHGIQSVSQFDLSGSSVFCFLQNGGNQALTSLEVYPLWLATDANNGFFFLVNQNVVSYYTRIGGVNNVVGSDSYFQPQFQYFRFREGDGLLFYEVSSVGGGWTVKYSLNIASVLGFSVSAMNLIMLAGCFNAEASGTTVGMDNINMGGKILSPTFTKTIRPAIFTPGRAR